MKNKLKTVLVAVSTMTLFSCSNNTIESDLQYEKDKNRLLRQELALVKQQLNNAYQYNNIRNSSTSNYNKHVDSINGLTSNTTPKTVYVTKNNINDNNTRVVYVNKKNNNNRKTVYVQTVDSVTKSTAKPVHIVNIIRATPKPYVVSNTVVKSSSFQKTRTPEKPAYKISLEKPSDKKSNKKRKK